MNEIGMRELRAVARVMAQKKLAERSAEELAFDQFTQPIRDRIAKLTAELEKAHREYTDLGGFPYWLRS